MISDSIKFLIFNEYVNVQTTVLDFKFLKLVLYLVSGLPHFTKWAK